MITEAQIAKPREEAALKDEERSFVRGAFSLTLCSIIAQVVNYGIHVGVGRFLAPSAYGSFAIIVATFSIIETVLRWGLAKSVAFHVARDKAGAKQILKKSLRLQTVYAVICFSVFYGLSDRVAVILGDPGLSSYLRAGAFFIVAFAFVPVYGGFLNGVGAFRKQGAMGVIRSLVMLSFVVTLLAYGFEIYSVIIAYTASTLAATVYGFWASRAASGTAKIPVQTKHIVAFGLPLFVSSLATSLLMRMDLFMIQSILTDRVLTGLYASACALIKAPYFLSLGTGLVLFRRVAQLRAKSPAAARDFISKTLYYYLLGLAPIPFILSASAEPILDLVYGQDYLLAAPALSILSFCFALMILHDVLMTAIAGLGRPRWSMVFGLALLPVQFVLVHQGIVAMRLTGAALATTACWGIGTLLGVIYLVRQGYLVLPKWKTFLRVGIASGASYYIALWGSPSGFWLIAFAPFIYLLYFTLIRLMGEISAGQVNSFVVNFLPARSRHPIGLGA